MRVGTLAVVLFGAWLLGGCATRPPASDAIATADYNDANDPLEPMNRTFFKVNNGLDHATLKPVATSYQNHVPAPVRGSVHNLMTNLNNPVQLANDMMQGKPRRAGDTLMRLLINTTVGVGGLFDVATGWGWPDHSTDFGVTLALWGVPSGDYLYLPLLGPSDPRDAVGYGANSLFDPFTWVSFGGSQTFSLSRLAIGTVDTRAQALGETNAIDKTALDPYATYRSLYRQNREAQIQKTRDDDRATVPAWYPAAR